MGLFLLGLIHDRPLWLSLCSVSRNRLLICEPLGRIGCHAGPVAKLWTGTGVLSSDDLLFSFNWLPFV